MDKKMMKIRYQLLLLFTLSSIHSHSQELFTDEFRWIPRDSMEVLAFQAKDQIIEWGKEHMPFASVLYEKVLNVKDSNIFIVDIAGFSGLIRRIIFVFKRCDDELWHLMTKTQQAILKEKITVKTNDDERVIMFETESGVIRKLSYDILK